MMMRRVVTSLHQIPVRNMKITLLCSARQLFNDLMNNNDNINGQLRCNHFDDVINNARSLDVHPISLDDFLDYLRPYPSKLQLKGNVAITILMIDKKYYMRMGNKTVHIASLSKKEISTVKRKKRAAVVKEGMRNTEVNTEVEKEVNGRGRGGGIHMSKKRSLDYERAMNARSGKMQKVIESKIVFVEELVSADMDDKKGSNDNTAAVEEDVEDIELYSDSDYEDEGGSEDDEVIGVIKNRTHLLRVEEDHCQRSQDMEVECNLSGKELHPTDISRLINNNNNSAHIVRSLGSQRTPQCMSEANMEEMKRKQEEITKIRAELVEDIKKVLLKEGYKKEISTELREALYDFSRTYEASAFKTNKSIEFFNSRSYIQLLMEVVLSIPATEAVCERFFRYSSLFTKRQYVTRLKESTVRDYTFVKHYLNQLWRLIAKNEQVNAVYGFFHVCLDEIQ